jgi:hypothetical protein
MSRISFIPGSTLKTNNTYLIYKKYESCRCIQPYYSKNKTGYNNPQQTTNMRISQSVNNNLGGRTTFGNLGTPLIVNYLGRVEGQPGGSLQALRNKF